MNENTIALYKQAMEFAYSQVTRSDDSRWHTLVVGKFAELLIGECAMVVNIWSGEVPCSEGYDKLSVAKLKEHFGVEQ